MRRGTNRILLAGLLTALAVAGPCALWYVAASSELERDITELRDAPLRDARRAANDLARQLRDRLESLRERETARPFFHYQNLYHDPRGAYGGESVIPSPIADSPADPLVHAHFQIDAQGIVSLPTLNEAIPERTTRNAPESQRLFKARLQPIAPVCVASMLEGETLAQMAWQSEVWTPYLHAMGVRVGGEPLALADTTQQQSRLHSAQQGGQGGQQWGGGASDDRRNAFRQSADANPSTPAADDAAGVQNRNAGDDGASNAVDESGADGNAPASGQQGAQSGDSDQRGRGAQQAPERLLDQIEQAYGSLRQAKQTLSRRQDAAANSNGPQHEAETSPTQQAKLNHEIQQRQVEDVEQLVLQQVQQTSEAAPGQSGADAPHQRLAQSDDPRATPPQRSNAATSSIDGSGQRGIARFYQSNVSRNGGQVESPQARAERRAWVQQIATLPKYDNTLLQSRLKNQEPAGPQQVKRIAPTVWAQNAEANLVYNDIRAQAGSKGKATPSSEDEGHAKQAGAKGSTGGKTAATKLDPLAVQNSRAARYATRGDVVIRLGGLRWRTIPVDGESTLMAMRQVSTPSGVWTQGFALSNEELGRWLNGRKGAVYPATLVPAPMIPTAIEPATSDEQVMVQSNAPDLVQTDQLAGDPSGTLPIAATDDSQSGHDGNAASHIVSAALPIDGVTWRIDVDATGSRAVAEAEIHALRAGFQWRFTAGAGVAALAGLLLIGLVWQSDRLARRRSQFAASAAHELRTPLAGLRMYGEMLAEGLGDPSKSPVYARRIADEADRLGRVVTNVLGFTRLERGALSVKPEPGNLGQVVREFIQRQQPQPAASDAELVIEVEDGLPSVRFDRDAVYQIVHNLIDNAEKYSRGCEDRRIHIKVAPSDAGRSQGGVTLAVRDHGPGIDAATASRMFRPFRRGDDADAPAGLGLGLALTRALAAKQGAGIRYHDAADGGAVFTLSFPAA